MSQCSSGVDKHNSQEITEMMMSKSMVNTMSGATTAEEIVMTKVVTPVINYSPIWPKISEGVIGGEKVKNVTSTTTRTPSMFDDEVNKSPICFALQLYHAPNATNEEFVICINCNHQSHKICTEQLLLQQPINDNLVITWKYFSHTVKERFKKTPAREKQNVLFLHSLQGPYLTGQIARE